MANYTNFINSILNSRGRFNCDGYKERHHIVPRCLGGSDDKSNLIDLYAEEHYLAHKLLALENPDNRGLVYGWHMMAFPKGNTKRDYIISAEDYAHLRKMCSKHMSENNPALDENGHPPNYGVPMSDEQKQHLSKVKKGVSRGPDSLETRNKKSEAAKLRYKLRPETFKSGTKNKKCITNGISIKYINLDESLPNGWYYGNCKAATKRSMHNYYSSPELMLKKSIQNSGKNNPNYGHGERQSGGKNGHATKWYKFEGKYFDCRKDLISYLKSNEVYCSDSALRSIENNTYGNCIKRKYKYIIDNLEWGYKNKNEN